MALFVCPFFALFLPYTVTDGGLCLPVLAYLSPPLDRIGERGIRST